MSLLLDALKRAEEAKRAKLAVESAAVTPQAREASRSAADFMAPSTGSKIDKPGMPNGGPSELKIEDYKEVIPTNTKVRPTVVDAPATSRLPPHPELALENFPGARPLDSPGLQAPLPVAGTAAPVLPSRLDATSADAAQSRDTARNVFTAKQATGREEGSRKKWLLPVIAVVLIVGGGGGWYVWNEVNRMTRPAAPMIAARSATAGALSPAQPTTGQPGARQQAESAPKSSEPVELPLPPLLPPPAAAAPLPALSPRVAVSGPPLSQRAALAKSLKDAPASKEAPIALQLARSMEPPAVHADLVDAYAALKTADYARARTLYAKLVQADPLNVDAQLGMATVFARRGDPTTAANHYRQVLAIDPRNGTALAGLLAMSDSRSPALEIELRTLVSRNPETSSLRFTLGNLYAAERRWVEAQQAYFEAYRLESTNADYVYNLAVSLDQLKQAKLALEYYRKALALSPKAGAQFDASAVVRRIHELSGDARNN